MHLVSLCLILEHGWPVELGIDAKRRLLDRQRAWTWLEPPGDPGAVTVLDLRDIDDPDAFRAGVDALAAAVWAAWSAHHTAVRRRAEDLLRTE